MANKTIAQLDTISGAIDNATDLAIMYDTSATKTVKTTIQNLLTTELSGLNTSGKNVVSAINEVYASISETISEIASEETSPASSNHNPGELILYNGGLYRTTSYIVIGESLTDTGESANIESITISECIKELYDVQTVLGNETLGTEATTVTGAIAEINNNIGSEEMGTDATTITGAIAEHEGDITSLNNNFPFVAKYITRSITIQTGTAASPSVTEIDLSSEAPAGKALYFAIVAIGVYCLPYIGPSAATYTTAYRISQNKLAIYNGGATWSGSQAVYILGFFR